MKLTFPPSGSCRTQFAWNNIFLSPHVLAAFFLIHLLSIIHTTALAQAPVTAWTARYNGTGNGIDETVKMLSDAAGNVYVTGISDGDASAGVNNDIVTIKYNADGVQQWTTRFNGLANGNDLVKDLAVDASGSVYVTGASQVPGQGFDMVTIKYSAAGTQDWVQYADAEKKEDAGNALALDATGNVYVTGYITKSDTVGTWWEEDEIFINQDYATWKYNGSGVLQWVNIYGTTGAWYTPYEKGDDIASKVVVDAAGNVYIAGESPTVYSSQCLLIKYSADGVQQWLAGAAYGVGAHIGGLTSDAAGNVWVASNFIPGDNDGNPGYYSFIVTRFNTAGALQWYQIHEDPFDPNEVTYHTYAAAFGLAVDAAGNVYVAGSQYEPDHGNIDYVTIKYSVSGVEQWVRTYDGGIGNDYSASIAVTPDGNSYVTGYANQVPGGINYTTLQYNTDGNQQWIVNYDGPNNGTDKATSLALGLSGSVYVTGTSDGGISGNDFVTIKYTPVPSTSAPAISGLAPLSAPVGVGVAIRGSNFTAGSTVRFNGVAATQVSFEGPDLLIATVPAGATSGSIQVITPAGTATSASSLTVAAVTSLWQAKSALPTARSQHGAVAISSNGRVYAFGGTNGSELSSLEIYNTNAFSWSAGAPIPTPTRGAAYVRGNDNQIYVLGGYGSGSNRSQSYKYNPATNSWTALASMPIPVWAASAAVQGDWIYVFGGQTSANTVSNSLQIYSIQYNFWIQGPVIPQRLMQAQAVSSYNGKIYLFGGRTASQGGLSDRVLIFDPSSYSWSGAASMPVPKAQFGTVLNNDGRIFVVGGRGSFVPNQGPFFHSVEIFDPKTNTWSEGSALPSAVGGQTVVNSNGNLFMMGGIDGAYRNYNWRLVLPPVGPTSAKATAISSSQIKVEWTDAAGNENRYEVERATSATGPWTVIATTAANAITHTDGNRVANTTYFYRVRGGNSSGYGPYSPVVSATTWAIGAIARESVEVEEGVDLQLQAAPNPFNDITTVSFTVQESGRVAIDLYDLQGKKVQGVFDSQVQAGELQQAYVNGGRLSQGIYLLRLVNGSQVKHLRLMFNK